MNTAWEQKVLTWASLPEPDAVHIADALVEKAIASQASDLYLDPEKNRLVVRLRIEGTYVTLEDPIEADQHNQLDSALAAFIAFYRAQLRKDIFQVSRLVEPVMVVFMGGAIGMIVMAMFFPMFEMINLVR